MSTLISGNNPANDKGRFFSSNKRWWPPLWLFTCDVAGLPDSLRRAGAYSDGDGLDEQGSLDAARALRAALADGRVDDHEKGLVDAIASATDETCNFCEGTGTTIGSDKSINCYRCSGTGKRKPWWVDHSFTREVVEYFTEFLENCGGFAIWGEMQSGQSMEALNNETPDTGADASKDDPSKGTPNTGTDVDEDAPAILFD
jgi:hypothetical protein